MQGIRQEFPDARIVGTEIYTAGLAFASRRLPSVALLQMDARKLPYVDEFDVLGVFDVIEHILEDELVLQNFYRAIKPGGGCLITVPQHQWLWSPLDDAACHQRRYSAMELRNKVEAADFCILRSASFVTLLLPLMLASRRAARRKDRVGDSEELVLNHVLDRVFAFIMQIEYALIQVSISLSIGGSRLLFATKPTDNNDFL